MAIVQCCGPLVHFFSSHQSWWLPGPCDMNQLFFSVGACDCGEVLWLPIGQKPFFAWVTTPPAASALGIDLSPHGTTGLEPLEAGWWPCFCQQLHPLEVPSPPLTPGSCHLFSSPPDRVLVWHWTGHAMCSCSLRDSRTCGHRLLCTSRASHSRCVPLLPGLFGGTRKPIAFPRGRIHQKHSACSLFLLIEWALVSLDKKEPSPMS